MSATIKELADAEAARAEAEPDDGDGGETGEPATDPDDEGEGAEAAATAESPVAQGPSEKELEALGRKLDKEYERYTLAVRKLMGADFDGWLECPLCPIPGHIPPPGSREVDPVQRVAVMIALGDEPEPEYRSTDTAKTCEACNGYGMVLSGSKHESHRLIPCGPCETKGWVSTIAAAPIYTLPPPPPPGIPAVVAVQGGGPTVPPTPQWDEATGKWAIPGQ